MRLKVALGTFLIASSMPLYSQERSLSPSGSGRRLALIIGNDSYPVKPLNNGVADALALAAALPRAGFNPPTLH